MRSDQQAPYGRTARLWHNTLLVLLNEVIDGCAVAETGDLMYSGCEAGAAGAIQHCVIHPFYYPAKCNMYH